ncbi:MAG: RsmD family RNA methyltransferase [Atopobiaceae bacterium]|nr:RsmD family RNA methyltransferase [Atopobiaceae bacterium]
MRIVGGKWRGRPIEAPDGRDVTRPTTDRTREQIASMVLSAFDLDLSEVTVLDAFAGSGAIGFELLSRGAKACAFVDADRKALSRVKRNASKLGADADACAVLPGDAFKLARRSSLPFAPFSLVVLDPPYALSSTDVSGLVQTLVESGKVKEGCVVLYERSSGGEGLSLPSARLVKSKTHGVTAVDLLRIGGPDE